MLVSTSSVQLITARDGAEVPKDAGLEAARPKARAKLSP
jgi:hypothetical protein